MLVKRFTAKTFEDALDNVKREMGPQAVILSKKLVKDDSKGMFALLSKPLIEVTAAVDRRLKTEIPPQPELQTTQQGVVQSKALSKDQVNNMIMSKALNMANQRKDTVSISSQAARMPVNAPQIDKKDLGVKRPQVLAKKYIEINDEDKVEDLVSERNNKSIKDSITKIEEMETRGGDLSHYRKELQDLKDKLNILLGSGEDLPLLKAPKTLRKLCFNLGVSGLDSTFVDAIVENVTANINPLLAKKENYLEGYVAKYLMDSTKCGGEITLYPSSSKIVVILGPTGIGKTTTLAKLAANFRGKGKNVALISLDTYKVGAIEQIKIYSNIMDVPFKVAYSGEEFSNAIAEFKDMNIILVDTVGRGKKSQEDITAMKELFDINLPVEKHLCLSANMKDQDALSMISRFTPLGIDRLLFTKLDETAIYGGIYNIMRKSGIQLSYFTTGQRVPDDLEVATKERVVDLIMKLSQN